MFPMNGGGCMAHMASQHVDFCPALQQLFKEHPPLRDQMTLLLKKGDQLSSQSPDTWRAGLHELANFEDTFKAELEIHSAKEEEGLFPILGRHIGTQHGPIAVMEYEHEEAKKQLSLFEEKMRDIPEALTEEVVSSIAAPLIQACMILMDHFMKEENVLFPMAENALTDEEKEELLQIVQSN